MFRSAPGLALVLGSIWFALPVAGAMAAGESEEIKDFTDVSPGELKIAFVAEKEDGKSGFIIAGKNAASLIAKLTELNGRTIADLEREMRPGAASEKGFLGAEEKLLEILAADNEYVVNQRGLTHQQLARALRILAAIGLKQPGQEFLYRGRRFSVRLAFYRGYQQSPFEDGTKSNCEATVKNLSNGKTLAYSLLVPDMIERYGFYEGRGTPYRVDPREILAVCDFLAAGGSSLHL